MIRKGLREDSGPVEEVISFVASHGGIEYAGRRAEEHRTKAVEAIATVPPSPARDALHDLASFVISRGT